MATGAEVATGAEEAGKGAAEVATGAEAAGTGSAEVANGAEEAGAGAAAARRRLGRGPRPARSGNHRAVEGIGLG